MPPPSAYRSGEPIGGSRKQALERGWVFYMGQRCKRCETRGFNEPEASALRYASNRMCRRCNGLLPGDGNKWVARIKNNRRQQRHRSKKREARNMILAHALQSAWGTILGLSEGQ